MRARFPFSSRLRRIAARFRRDARGVSTVEYGLILAFIVLMMFGALKSVATANSNMWNDISTRVTTAR